MKYMETGSRNPYFNLAFEEYILTNKRGGDYILLWQNDNTIVFGANQNPLEEINMEAAEAEGVKTVRRGTGGGAVYHDLGNLNFSYITDWNEGRQPGYVRFLEPVCQAFASIGLNVKLEGRNDLLLDGKKISGSAQRLLSDRVLHHGTLLVNSDLSVLGRVLNVSTEKIASKGIKSVRSRVTNISDYVSGKLSVDDVKKLLLNHWFGGMPEPVKLTEAELAEVEELAKNKYASWDWIYGRSPKFQYRNKKRFDGGTVEVNLEISEGRIQDSLINGDFLSLKDITDVEKALKGVIYTRDGVAAVLSKLPLELYFDSITREQILSCFWM